MSFHKIPSPSDGQHFTEQNLVPHLAGVTPNLTFDLGVSHAFTGKRPRHISPDAWATIQHDNQQKGRAYGAAFGKGWHNQRLSVRALLVHHIGRGGAVLQATTTDGTHKASGMTPTNAVFVDMDENVQPGDVVAHPFFNQHGVLAHGSSTCSPDYGKTHGVILLDRKLQGHWLALVKAAINRELAAFEMDDAMMKPGQPVFGSTYPELYVNDAPVPVNVDALLDQHRALVDEQVHTLRTQALRRRHKRDRQPSPTGTSLTSGGGGFTGDLPDAFIAAVLHAAGITSPAHTNRSGYTHQAVACPVGNHEHDATDPKTQYNPDTHSFHCFKCGQNFNMKTMGEAHGVTLADYLPQRPPPDKPRPWSAAVPHPPPDVLPDIIIDVDYITQADLPDDDLLIKSDQGTGKTEFLVSVDSDRFIVPSHRRALVDNTADRLNAESSNSFGNDDLTNGDMRAANKLAITLNKLKHLVDPDTGQLPEPGSYDLFLDEITQFVPHLSGGTFAPGEGGHAYRILKQLIVNARRVIALDAGADRLIQNWLQQLRPGLITVVNTRQRTRGKLHTYERKSALLRRLLDLAATSDQPVFVPTDSRTFANELAHLLRGKGMKVMNVNSDTTGEPDVRAFIRDIDGLAPDYDVVIYSPTFGSGVDIQGRGRAVCAFIFGGVLDAPEVLQLIDRVRHTDETHLYISAGSDHRETDPRVIYERKLTAARQTGVLCDFDDHGKLDFTPVHREFHGMLSRVNAGRNHSLNHLRADVMRLATGYTSVTHHDDHDPAATKAHRAARHAVDQADKDRTLTAAPVDAETYQFAALGNTLTPEIRSGYLRWKIEQATGREIDETLYDTFKDGRQRAALYRLTDVLHEDIEKIQARDRRDAEGELHKRTHATQQYLMLKRLMTDVFGADWRTDLELTEYQIKTRMKDWLTEHEGALYTVFDRRRDKSKETIPLLRWLLKKIGLRLDSRRVRRDGGRVRVYSLNAERLHEWRALAASCHTAREARRQENASHQPTRQKQKGASGAVSQKRDNDDITPRNWDTPQANAPKNERHGAEVVRLLALI